MKRRLVKVVPFSAPFGALLSFSSAQHEWAVDGDRKVVRVYEVVE